MTVFALQHAPQVQAEMLPAEDDDERAQLWFNTTVARVAQQRPGLVERHVRAVLLWTVRCISREWYHTMLERTKHEVHHHLDRLVARVADEVARHDRRPREGTTGDEPPSQRPRLAWG